MPVKRLVDIFKRIKSIKVITEKHRRLWKHSLLCFLFGLEISYLKSFLQIKKQGENSK